MAHAMDKEREAPVEEVWIDNDYTHNEETTIQGFYLKNMKGASHEKQTKKPKKAKKKGC